MFKFGTSGIRDLTTNLLKNQIAAKLAKHLNQMGWHELSLGRDGRQGSDKLMQEFMTNFSGQINNLGITTTPEVCAQNGLAVMITASHNPSEYCGFKLYLNHIEQNSADLTPVPTYNKWHDLPTDMIIDCANGSLGAKLKSLGFTNLINIKGKINQDCGATHPENLAQYCREHQLEIGFAVDGDADRCLVFLDTRILTSEEVTFLLGKLLNLKQIVIDETVNSALSKHFTTVCSQVGGHNVLAAMQRYHINFGAEKSGHYYFDPNFGASDALDTIIIMTKGYRQYSKSGLQKMLAKYRPYYQLTKNFKIDELPPNYQELLSQLKLTKKIRVVIRPSGTEPLLRIMLEGKTKSAVDKQFAQITQLLKIN